MGNGMAFIDIHLLASSLLSRLAAAGETVLVTDRDKVVAQFGPPGPERATEVHDVLLAEAVRKGWVTPVLARAMDPFPRPVKTLDALHLSSALFILESDPDLALATYDEKMAALAKKLGMKTVKGF